MTYARLQDFSNAEDLQQALEVAAVARVAKGRLTVDDALGMEEKAAAAALQLIRFADTAGVPRCTKCSSTDTYHLRVRRNVWKCQHCDHEFSLTSGTMLHGKKMALQKYLALLSIVLDKSQFKSLREFSNESGMDYKTAWSQINRFRICAGGEGGCTVPFAIMSRGAWLLKCKAQRSNFSRFMTGRRNLNYPYLQEQQAPSEGADLLSFVNNLVPRWVPEYMRADMCQDMVVAILAGEIERDQMPNRSKEFLTRVYQDFPWKYKWMSFDAPRNQDDDRTLHDMLDAESVGDHFQRVHR